MFGSRKESKTHTLGSWRAFYKSQEDDNFGHSCYRWNVVALYSSGDSFSRILVAGGMDEEDADELITILSETQAEEMVAALRCSCGRYHSASVPCPWKDPG